MALTTRSLVVTRHGGPEVLSVQDWPLPEPGANQLLVKVAAAGVNFIDVYHREGIYPMQLPFVLCREGAGMVVEAGPGVTGFEPGDRVAWVSQGSGGTHALVQADRTAHVPDTVVIDVAVAAMLQGLTAHALTASTYPVQPGDWALVHAAAGGVGQLLVQMIRARGGRVVATVSTEAKAAKVRALGAEHVINYTDVQDVAATVRELTGGVGVAVAYDGVGRSTFDASLDSLRTRGMLVLFGGASGQVPPFDPQRLNAAGSAFLTRPKLENYLQTGEEFAERAAAVLTGIATGELVTEIGGRYPIAQAAQAYEDLQARRTTGKLLLIP